MQNDTQNIAKLAIFDVDGTIAINGAIPQSIIAGIEHIQSIGYATTISTGRGYLKAKESLAAQFDTIISPSALMILEHGTKICDRAGQVIYADYFSETEIQHVLEFTRANIEMVRIMWFNRPDPNEKVQIWCYNPNNLAEEKTKRGHYAEVFSCPFEELRQELLAKPLSSVGTKLNDFVKVENLKLHFTRTDTNLLFQDGNMEFVQNTSSKASAILYIEKAYDVELATLIIAGNAINDVEMLNLPASKRILVGNVTDRATVFPYLVNQEEVITVESPEDLGLFLQNI